MIAHGQVVVTMQAIERTSTGEFDGDIRRSALARKPAVKIAAEFSVIYSLHAYLYGAKSLKIKELAIRPLDFVDRRLYLLDQADFF